MLEGKIYPFEFWKKNLHLTRNQFLNLTNELQPYISPSLLSSNHRALNADKKLTLTLYYFRDTGSLIMTANNFRVAISAVMYEVYLAISQNLEPQYIRSLKTREEMREVSAFEAKFGMIQAFGCIDGTHTHQVSTGKFTGLLLLQVVLFIKCTGSVRL